MISVNRNDFYPLTSNGLASPMSAGPVSSVVGANGVFADTAGTFPTGSWNSSNYFVDLLAVAVAPPPTVDGTTPGDTATNVPTLVSPTATFSRAMDPSTLTTGSVTLSPQGGSPVPATVTYDAVNNRVTLSPTTNLAPSTTYTAQITTAAGGADGAPLAAPVTWSFTTAARRPASCSPTRRPRSLTRTRSPTGARAGPVHLRDGRQGRRHGRQPDPRRPLLQEPRRDRHARRPRLDLGRHAARPGHLHRRERLGLADPPTGARPWRSRPARPT